MKQTKTRGFHAEIIVMENWNTFQSKLQNFFLSFRMSGTDHVS